MKFHRDGYTLRPGGIAYGKAVEFMGKGAKRGKVEARVTLVRSARTGRLLRVERPGRKAPPC